VRAERVYQESMDSNPKRSPFAAPHPAFPAASDFSRESRPRIPQGFGRINLRAPRSFGFSNRDCILMKAASHEIFISAGSSGDLHGSHLARAIWSIAHGAPVLPGGPRMQAGALRSSSTIEHFRRGGHELAGHIRAIYGAWRKIRPILRPPSVCRLIDFPISISSLESLPKKSARKSSTTSAPSLGLAGGTR